MEKRIRPCRELRAEVNPPGDKSISHRAVILNGIAAGNATVENFSSGKDCYSSIACMKALGVKIEDSPIERRLEVAGARKEGLQEPEDVLDAGNSGTTIRLLSGLLAAQPFLSVITGDSSLRSRPMARIIDPLRRMGAEIRARRNDTLAPLVIKGGNLKAIRYRLPVASAQLKSSILLAALYADGETIIEGPIKSRDHTERLLHAMGADIHVSESEISLRPGALNAVDIHVPGDISSAAYWLVAGIVHPNAKVRVNNVGMNPSRTGIIDVLREMGAKIEVSNERNQGGEPVADLTAESSELRATEIGGEMIPRVIDELPIIAAAAALARGTTVIREAAELRVKESDRIATVTRELSKMGAKIEEFPDGMKISGVKGLQSTRCSVYNDHRLAMTLAIAGLVAKGETVIEGAEVVEISYPGFWQEMDRLS